MTAESCRNPQPEGATLNPRPKAVPRRAGFGFRSPKSWSFRNMHILLLLLYYSSYKLVFIRGEALEIQGAKGPDGHRHRTLQALGFAASVALNSEGPWGAGGSEERARGFEFWSQLQAGYSLGAGACRKSIISESHKYMNKSVTASKKNTAITATIRKYT